MSTIDLTNVLNTLKNQGVIAYPTESVFGLGCDPDSPVAINKVLQLKNRCADKGLILIAANIEQLQNYGDFSALTTQQLAIIKKTWPGPFTWVVPAKKNISKLITGNFNSIAIRVSAHPIVQQLCLQFNKPIISTSANLSGFPPCTTSQQVSKMFTNHPLLESIIDAPVSGLAAPSKIFDARSGKRLR